MTDAQPKPAAAPEPDHRRRTDFHRHCAMLGVEVDPRLVWYHCVDLGDGLVTPGIFDLRPVLAEYQIPHDLGGHRVLEIGPANGFFTAELLRRNADLTVLELPSMACLDRLPGRELEDVVKAAQHFFRPHTPQLPERLDIPLLDWLLLDGPFGFCRRRLGLDIERRRGTIYQAGVPALRLGRFDLILLGDVLLHCMDPIRALSSVASVCDGTLIIAQPMPLDPADTPRADWAGGDDPAIDNFTWWLPNLAWFQQMLHKLGFRSVEPVSRFDTPILSAGAAATARTVIHARR